MKEAWRDVRQALAEYDRYKAAWDRAKAALGRFRPDGRLNDRAWAEAEIRAACEEMPHTRWAHLRSLLQDERTLSFLDRMHQQLTDAAPRPELREALAELWRLERTGGRGAEILAAVQCRICACLSPDWRTGYARVSAALVEAVAASSAVECVNAVLRMHQCRHRTVTQELLDLKRLYWNTRPLGSGWRRGRCPYELLGLKLSSYRFWELLNRDATELARELSTQGVQS